MDLSFSERRYLGLSILVALRNYMQLVVDGVPLEFLCIDKQGYNNIDHRVIKQLILLFSNNSYEMLVVSLFLE